MKKWTIALLCLCICSLLISCSRRQEDIPLVPATKPGSSQVSGDAQNPNISQTEAPTEAPTEVPTETPTEVPTEAPTEAPTEVPTEAPTEAPTEPTETADISVGQKVADLAIAQLGKPYDYGGSGPDAFDVSGLIFYCFQENEIKTPRTVKELAGFGTEVSKDELLPGDAVFFYSDEPGKVQYGGIYIGGGKFIAARNSDKPVSEMSLNSSYFSERFICARRYWES